ncbi:MAG: DNA polymerase IV [Rhizobiales bacterium 62-17]|nr:DNA polymerase IV [Hyphomicrobiales bacterium]OJY04593.1 MAG: DNA polymerase IV [Rhizobiales bacterium 62-17]
MDKMILCRDCHARSPAGGRRCAACGSPRIISHDELDQLSVAHIDCDAFYAAIEKRDNPALRDEPLIVGGGKRGVVSTCCYIARTYGVRSAMPMFKALALCPQAKVVRPDMQKYVTVGHQVREAMLELTPLVEPLSIDEAFLDLGGTERLHQASAAAVLARFASRIERELGITVSVGLSYCKFLAKMASDLDKPRGFAVIGQAEAKTFLGARPVSAIWGVGKVAQERFEREGLRMISDIQALEEIDMFRRFGPEGRRLWRLSHGLDDRVVSPERERKSVSAETTFEEDISDLTVLSQKLFLLSEKVSSRLKAQGISGDSLTLKLKTADFRILTRARMLSEPTQLAGRIFETARDLLAKEGNGRRYRLIGVGISNLVEAAQADHGDLADTRVVREKATETAIDSLREKFGRAAITKGIVFGKR